MRWKEQGNKKSKKQHQQASNVRENTQSCLKILKGRLLMFVVDWISFQSSAVSFTFSVDACRLPIYAVDEEASPLPGANGLVNVQTIFSPSVQ